MTLNPKKATASCLRWQIPEGLKCIHLPFISNSRRGVQLSTRSHIIKSESRQYRVQFDSLLMGHDDWVHSVDWYQQGATLLLASASADKSIIIWSQDATSGVWISQARFGDFGGTSAILGFYNVQFSSLAGGVVIGHSYNGSLQFWDHTPGITGRSIVAPRIGISGHFAAVKDIAWDPRGSYLLSASLDETCRCWTQWGDATWHEVARPQIHGYAVTSIAFFRDHAYVCGAEEKVLRVFSAPRVFQRSLRNIRGAAGSGEPVDYADQPADGEDQATGACLPALGLSNKAVAGTDAAGRLDTGKVVLEEPPLESHLLQHTLWPEIEKLYGHSYEMKKVTCSHDGKLFASASKATRPEFAAVWLASGVLTTQFRFVYGRL